MSLFAVISGPMLFSCRCLSTFCGVQFDYSISFYLLQSLQATCKVQGYLSVQIFAVALFSVIILKFTWNNCEWECFSLFLVGFILIEIIKVFIYYYFTHLLMLFTHLNVHWTTQNTLPSITVYLLYFCFIYLVAELIGFLLKSGFLPGSSQR